MTIQSVLLEQLLICYKAWNTSHSQTLWQADCKSVDEPLGLFVTVIVEKHGLEKHLNE